MQSGWACWELWKYRARTHTKGIEAPQMSTRAVLPCAVGPTKDTMIAANLLQRREANACSATLKPLAWQAYCRLGPVRQEPERTPSRLPHCDIPESWQGAEMARTHPASSPRPSLACGSIF